MALDPNAQANIDPNTWAELVKLDERVTELEMLYMNVDQEGPGVVPVVVPEGDQIYQSAWDPDSGWPLETPSSAVYIDLGRTNPANPGTYTIEDVFGKTNVLHIEVAKATYDADPPPSATNNRHAEFKTFPLGWQGSDTTYPGRGNYGVQGTPYWFVFDHYVTFTDGDQDSASQHNTMMQCFHDSLAPVLSLTMTPSTDNYRILLQSTNGSRQDTVDTGLPVTPNVWHNWKFRVVFDVNGTNEELDVYHNDSLVYSESGEPLGNTDAQNDATEFRVGMYKGGFGGTQDRNIYLHNVQVWEE